MPFGQAADIATFVALALALVSWYWERRNRKQLQNEEYRRIWSDVSKIRGLMADLEKDEEVDANGAGRLQAVGKLSIILRDLLREACLLEKNLSVQTIEKWRTIGKLSSDWQEHLALMMLRTDEIDLQHLSDAMLGKYASLDELPEGHSMRAPSSGDLQSRPSPEAP